MDFKPIQPCPSPDYAEFREFMEHQWQRLIASLGIPSHIIMGAC